MPTWQQFGLHRGYLLDDVLFLEINGDIAQAQAQFILDRSDQILSRHGYIFTITDARNAGTPSPESRRLLAASRSGRDTTAIPVIFGIHGALRAFARISQRAAQLLGATLDEWYLVKDEAEAWAQVETLRGRVRAEVAARRSARSRQETGKR